MVKIWQLKKKINYESKYWANLTCIASSAFIVLTVDSNTSREVNKRGNTFLPIHNDFCIKHLLFTFLWSKRKYDAFNKINKAKDKKQYSWKAL